MKESSSVRDVNAIFEFCVVFVIIFALSAIVIVAPVIIVMISSSASTATGTSPPKSTASSASAIGVDLPAPNAGLLVLRKQSADAGLHKGYRFQEGFIVAIAA